MNIPQRSLLSRPDVAGTAVAPDGEAGSRSGTPARMRVKTDMPKLDRMWASALESIRYRQDLYSSGGPPGAKRHGRR